MGPVQNILTITLNPALDVTTTLDRLEPQRKLRCSAPLHNPGGGGVNVSRAIRELGGQSTAFVAVGGHTGRQLRQLFGDTGIDCEFFEIARETRFSFTAMEAATGLHYRFVMPGPEVGPDESDRLLARLSELMAQRPGYVVASGSLPPGIPDDFYARLAVRAREVGARLIVDTHGAPLREAALARPFLIRLNHLEAQELVGGDADSAAHLLARELIARKLCEAAIVTLGDRGAIVASAHGETEIRPPKVTVRSSVGAGDSFVAALMVGLSRLWTLEDAARYGVAAAAATVTTEATALCSREMVDRFFAEIGGGVQAAEA